MNLGINTDALRDIASTISAKAGSYDAKLEELYTKFNNLSSYWSGKDYESAKSVMEANKNPLLELGTTLHKISSALHSTADKYDSMISASAAQFG